MRLGGHGDWHWHWRRWGRERGGRRRGSGDDESAAGVLLSVLLLGVFDVLVRGCEVHVFGVPLFDDAFFDDVAGAGAGGDDFEFALLVLVGELEKVVDVLLAEGLLNDYDVALFNKGIPQVNERALRNQPGGDPCLALLRVLGGSPRRPGRGG